MSKALMIPDQTLGFAEMKEQAGMLVKSGFLPKAVNTAEKALAIIMAGQELNIPPMTALQNIYVVDQKPTMAAKFMLARINMYYPGTMVEYPEQSAEKCTIRVTKPGGKPQTFTWTIQQAQKAGLARKDNWQKYPEAMLRNRAISEMARAMFPEVLGPCAYTPDEMGLVTTPAGTVDQTTYEEPPEQAIPDPAPADDEVVDWSQPDHIDFAKKITADIGDDAKRNLFNASQGKTIGEFKIMVDEVANA